MAESGMRAWLKDMAKGTKEQKEPLLIGSEYVQTKKLIQSYEEQLKFHDGKLAVAEAELAAYQKVGHYSRIVGAGFTVKGYGLLIPLRDDLDIVAELTAIKNELRTDYGLGKYLADPKSVGRFVIYPYPVKELAIFFPEFLSYNLMDEIDKMAKACEASYRAQVHRKAMKSIEDYIRMEENSATICGNRELAERLKDSDTTLLVGLAAGTQADAEADRGRIVESEPTPAEVQQALNDLANKDLEIRTPPTVEIPGFEPDKKKLVGVDVVNAKRPRKKIKETEKRMKAKAPKAKKTTETTKEPSQEKAAA